MRILSIPLALCLLILPVAAQDAAPTAPPPAAATAPAERAAPPEEAGAEAEPSGPALPAAVTDPTTSTKELKLRLLPLTKPELAEAAAAWLGIVKAKTQEVSDAMVAVSESSGEATDTQRERVATLTAERKALFDNYSEVIRAWELKGGDPAAVADYKAYQSAIFIDEVRTSDLATLFDRAVDWLTSADGGGELLVDIIVIMLAIGALIVAAGMVRRMAGRGISRVPNLSKLLQAFLLVAIYWATIAVGLMVVLSALGVDITPLFAIVGGASFILAFALQDTLSNLAAGLMIMINRPFDEGDYVDIGGTAGTVQKMNIVSTTVTTPDNQIILVPNGKVWGNIITNVTGSALRRVDLVFGIGYSDSVAKAQALLETIVAEHPLTLADPAATIRVHALGESSVDFIVRPWVKSADYWAVYWDLTRAVKERFDEAGISIPFPQRDVHVHPAGAATSLAAE
ncbi:mechanosensitive ion channel family protein [Acuticoccus sp. I52.16.1]|uniref:mechanosensitive ion channel family protein n=1 Tax=Acuticoccus sp. I52.16.1 TaxID=2928472 RepID=UPI001FD0677A|nr:mechanosensitive ion channel domain-containing protein [Acuticoccus sp. I52.16.1]UOM32684.1 mechanosensitive ion channel [Acuticoccus sp. I52.16.1]